MGSAASVCENDEDIVQMAGEAVDSMGLDGTSDEDSAKILSDLKLAFGAAKALDEEEEVYTGQFPGGGANAKGENKKAGIWAWKVSCYLKGAALFCKNMEAVLGLYEKMGPVNVPKCGLQVTRKALLAKGVSAAYVNFFMSEIGKEKVQSGLSEAHYMAAITAIMTSENGDMSNWDAEKWVILDKSKSPITAAVKGDLDKLDTKGEFGINQHEFRVYWFQHFMNCGEEATLKQLEKFSGMIAGDAGK
jgi:hypothetical protein